MSPLKQKGIARAYAVSYAFFRVAQALGVKEMKDAMSSYGTAVLKDYLEDETIALEERLVSATYLLRMAADTGMIQPGSFEFIAKEIGELKAVLVELAAVSAERAKESPRELDLVPPKIMFEVSKPQAKSEKKTKREDVFEADEDVDIFSEDGPTDADLAALEIEERGESFEDERVGAKKKTLPSVVSPSERFAAMNNGNIRQRSIVARIRQTGNCRVREIQEIFPELSERTIRYDLQKLVEDGSIERVGNGGPDTLYRLRKTRSSASDIGLAYPADAPVMVAEGRL